MDNAVIERVPPNSLPAEKAVLGATMIDRNALAVVIGAIYEPEIFYSIIHQKIFTAIQEIYNSGDAVDIITLTNQLKNHGELEDIGGVPYLNSLMEVTPTVTNIESYIKILKDKATMRKLIVAGMNVVSLGYKESEQIEIALDSAEQEIFDISEKRQATDFIPISQALAPAVEHIEELYKRKAHITGVPSGFSKLDHITSGFQNGNLIIVAARPSMGKTALCLNMAQYAAIRENIAVGIFSMEMPKEDLMQRFLCSEARIDGMRLKTGAIQDDEWQQLAQAASRLNEAPIFIDDSGNLSVMEVRSKARRLKSKYPDLGLIIIDYLQLMRGAAIYRGDRNKEIGEISRQLKGLAKELNIPIIALSQLSRDVEKRDNKRPVLSDLRESGSIEQDADLVMFIYRENYYDKNSKDEKKSEIIVAKHRNGPTGVVELIFMNQYATFNEEDKRFA